MANYNIKRWITLAIFTATEIILSRFCSISTPVVKIGFGFLPIAMLGMLYGPLWAGGAAALADFIGALLFPIGPYFPGFTLTAMLSGCVYGMLLQQKRDWPRIVFAVMLIAIPLNLCLDSFWLHILYGEGYLALLPARLLKCVVMTPAQIIMIRLVSTRLHMIANIGSHAKTKV